MCGGCEDELLDRLIGLCSLSHKKKKKTKKKLTSKRLMLFEVIIV